MICVEGGKDVKGIGVVGCDKEVHHSGEMFSQVYHGTNSESFEKEDCIGGCSSGESALVP